MIPKKIHYCWFGKNTIPEDVQRCIDSWKKYMPDYEIIQWDESNYNIEENIDYVQEAYSQKKWAFVSDYARLDIIHKNGGIYLDTDVEVIKPFDQLLKHQAFFGMEEPGRVNTGLGFGAEKNSEILTQLMELYKDLHFYHKNRMNNMTCVDLALPIFKEWGVTEKNSVHRINNSAIVYPTEYFCPKNFSGKGKISENSYSIHHYSSSWRESSIFGKEKVVLKIFLRKHINKFFGSGTYEKIKNNLKGKV